MNSLHRIGWWLFNMAPAVAEMRGHPDFKDWGNSLHALGQAEGLTPLQKFINDIASDALATMDPWEKLLTKEEAQTVPHDVYINASRVAVTTAASSPHAAFILSLTAMFGWASAMDEGLYEQINGMPDYGWVEIPYACAFTAIKIGAIDGVKELVDESYDTLMAAKYWFDERLRAALDKYRELAGKIARKYDTAVANLTDELRESCRPQQANFRAEVGALLWSLGMVAESQLFLSTANPDVVPSRRLFRKVVQQSLDCISQDSLVQYVWLEMKDRPPFNIRDHKTLFARINVRYKQLMLDEFAVTDAPPSEVYAKSLIAWFRDDISREQVSEYLQMYELIHLMFPEVDGPLYIRMTALAHILARKFDMLPEAIRGEGEINHWYWLADFARSVRERANLYPEWSEINNRANVAMFYLIEHEFSVNAGSNQSDADALGRVMEKVEGLRASTLSYWLRIAPPILTPQMEARLAPLLEKENELLGYLRGAYFLTIYPQLPRHYHRYGVNINEMLALKQGLDGTKGLDADTGRTEFKEIVKELDALYQQMMEVAPEYAAKCLSPQAELNELLATSLS